MTENFPFNESRFVPEELDRQRGCLVAKSTVSLSIHGEDLEPDAISELLQIESTSSHRKGDYVGKSKHLRRAGHWSVSLECWSPTGPAELIENLLDMLDARKTELHAIAEEFGARLFVGIFMSRSNEGFSLPVDLINRVAEFKLRLDFDIYSPDLCGS